jgi:hypothetical protein
LVGSFYAFSNPTQPLAVLIIVTIVVSLGLHVFSYYVGEKRPRGSRFSLRWTYFQYMQHPYREMPDEDARTAWANLGQQEEALMGAWACPGHCDRRYFIGEMNGIRYFLYDHVPREPLVRWVAGYMFMYAKDAPFTETPVRELRDADVAG